MLSGRQAFSHLPNGLTNRQFEGAGESGSYDERTAVVPMPDFSSALADQADPKAMIDAMVDMILAEHHLYRTMLPLETIDAVKK